MKHLSHQIPFSLGLLYAYEPTYRPEQLHKSPTPIGSSSDISNYRQSDLSLNCCNEHVEKQTSTRTPKQHLLVKLLANTSSCTP